MTQTARSMTFAMLCAAVVSAQFAAGKATRDALFFTSLTVTALPAVVTVTALFSIALVFLQGRLTRLVAPARLVPASFLVSGILFVAEWLLRSKGPSAAAVVLYLHVSGAGPLLASGFWLIATERFNPRTAKKGFGRITAVGTIGALAGALLAERIATYWGGPSMVLVLGALQFLAAFLVSRVTAGAPPAPEAAQDPNLVMPAVRGGVRLIADTPALRDLATLVLLGTASAAVLDYVFKARAVEAFGAGDGLLRFFALYYAATSVVAFVLQASSSRAVLERFGLALTTSTPFIALLTGSVIGLISPGFSSLLLARGGESVFRGSLFRAGYELFFTPMAAADKRAAKSLIDVAFDRLGDAVGAAFVRLVIVAAPLDQYSVLLGIVIATSGAATAVASRLNRWYLRTLETSLVTRGRALADADTVDPSTARVVRSIRNRKAGSAGPATRGPVYGTVAPGLAYSVMTDGAPAYPAIDDADDSAEAADEVVRDILALRSGSHDAAMIVLGRGEGLAAPLVPHVIPLLASPSLADYALFALRKVAEERVGQLTDALLDPNQDDTIRRRLARVFSVCVSQRAVDGLLAALDDPRFDVRFQTARSLAAILDRNPRVAVDRERLFRVVLEEVTVSRPVWESQRLLDGFVSASPLDAYVRDRAGQSLAHVFTLLSLVLPRQPLQIAFRSLHSEDAYLRGTALEYLDGVLPPAIRQGLWPFLTRPRRRTGHPRAEDIASLLRSSSSLTVQGAAREHDEGSVAGFTTH